MKTTSMAIAILLTAAAFVSAGNVAIPDPVETAPSDDELTYFDGTSWWLSWDGTYRGTWFNSADFYGGPYNVLINASELWFYHHPSCPWDTSEYFFELHNGPQSGPDYEHFRVQCTALHYAPSEPEYDDCYTCEPQFWLVASTELSSGGWPSILGDNTPNEVDHSFYSDDFETWEPWIIQGPTANDYEMYCWWDCYGPGYGFESATWGAVKALF
ncbi:MAG: hypothetical protein R6U36_02835 [Candidatus Fermentibacteraceae bacterium]